MPVDVRRKGEDGFFGSLAIWAALFACKAPYHQDRVRKNADALSLGHEYMLVPNALDINLVKRPLAAMSTYFSRDVT